jgi:glycosyltransferase involved in cell wall biosynthesis
LKKAFIFCESDPNREPRVIRTVEALSLKYEITICGYLPYKNLSFFDLGKFVERRKQITFHLKYPALIRKPISAFLNLFYYKKSNNILNPFLNSIKASEVIHQLKPNVVICHGLGFLQLCSELKTSGTKLILNAHEYYPAEFEDKQEWKGLGEKYKSVLNSCSSKIDLIFAVNETIGVRYQKEFKIPFVEITNATDHEADLKPIPVTEPIKIIHHGVALVNRKIEIMIEAVLKSSTSCELHLILVPTEKEYFQKLVSKYNGNKRIIFSDTVAVKQISKHINQFDLGLFYLEPVNYNWKHALPNKLFEFVQARLAVMVSPNPDMKKVVEQYKLGWVTKDFSMDSLVDAINSVSVKKIEYFKNNSQEFSKELSSSKTKQLMLESVEQLCAA